MDTKEVLKENIIYEPFNTLEEQEKAENEIKKEFEARYTLELNEEELEEFERNKDKLIMHEIKV